MPVSSKKYVTSFMPLTSPSRTLIKVGRLLLTEEEWTLLDVNDLTVEEVTERLRNVEQRKKNTISAVDKVGRLLLTEEEWLARLKLRDDTCESNGPSSRKGGKKP